MNRKVELKIMLKTTLYCIALFLIVGACIYYYIDNFYVYRQDVRATKQIVSAAQDLPLNTVLDATMLYYKTVDSSYVNDNMITNIQDAYGKKTLAQLKKNDILRLHELLEKSLWYSNDERIIVLPMDIEQRLGNLVTKGSEVDIKIKGKNSMPQVVLSKVRVDEIIDENGIPAGNQVGAKRTFVKFVLNTEQRKRVYCAQDFGKLFVELYCNSLQYQVVEDFKIPLEYYTDPSKELIMKR